MVTWLLLQNGDITYCLHKVKTFSPFSSSEWQLSDGDTKSPGTIIIRKAPFARHVSFERQDGSLITDMGARLLMTGSEFCWGGKVYRYMPQAVACMLQQSATGLLLFQIVPINIPAVTSGMCIMGSAFALATMAVPTLALAAQSVQNQLSKEQRCQPDRPLQIIHSRMSFSQIELYMCIFHEVRTC